MRSERFGSICLLAVPWGAMGCWKAMSPVVARWNAPAARYPTVRQREKMTRTIMSQFLRWVARCSIRLAMRVDPPPPEIILRGLNTLLDSDRRSAALRRLNDVALADLVIESPLWGDRSVCGVEGDFLSAMLDRLYRAEGGPMSDEEYDQLLDWLEQR